VTDVYMEQGDLGGAAMVFKPFKRRIRLVYDSRQIAEEQALGLLRAHCPDLDSMHVVHRSPAV